MHQSVRRIRQPVSAFRCYTTACQKIYAHQTDRSLNTGGSVFGAGRALATANPGVDASRARLLNFLERNKVPPPPEVAKTFEGGSGVPAAPT
jgi:hypothetical protein